MKRACLQVYSVQTCSKIQEYQGHDITDLLPEMTKKTNVNNAAFGQSTLGGYSWWCFSSRFICSFLNLRNASGSFQICVQGSAVPSHRHINKSVNEPCYCSLCLNLVIFSWTLSRLVLNLLARVHPRGQDPGAKSRTRLLEIFI